MRELTPQQIEVHLRSVEPLVSRYVKLHARGWKSHEPDLRAVGNEAAIRAARDHDPSTGVPFPAFAQRWIAGAMLAYVLREQREKDPQETAVRGAHYSEPYRRPVAAFDLWDVTDPKARTVLAAREQRLRVQRLAAAALMATDAPIDPEAMFLEREEIAHAVNTLNKVLASFVSAQRDAFRMHFIQGIEQEDVATRLGVSSRTVLRYLRAVEEGLKQGLVEAGIESHENFILAWYAVQSADEG